jgi:hypothetical protein
MPTSVVCPKCGRSVRVPDEAVGKRVLCPHCKQVLAVETSPTAPILPEEPPVPPQRVILVGIDSPIADQFRHAFRWSAIWIVVSLVWLVGGLMIWFLASVIYSASIPIPRS